MSKRRKIMFSIPAYDSKMYCLGMTSIFHNIEELRSKYDITFQFQMAGAYIDLARNKLVHEFLKDGCDDLIFIDSDLAFEADAIVKLMERDVQVVGGVYPYREACDEGFPIDIKLDEKKFPVTDFDLGLIECHHLPTGLMRIRRDVFDILAKRYPHMVNDQGIYQFFSTGQLRMYEEMANKLINEVKRLKGLPHDESINVDTDNPYEGCDNRWFGEDVYFCKMCNDVGIKIYCDPTIEFVHFGTLPKRGKYADLLKQGGLKPKGCEGVLNHG